MNEEQQKAQRRFNELLAIFEESVRVRMAMVAELLLRPGARTAASLATAANEASDARQALTDFFAIYLTNEPEDPKVTQAAVDAAFKAGFHEGQEWGSYDLYLRGNMTDDEKLQERLAAFNVSKLIKDLS